MLNISAKEFVPAASPARGGAPAAATPKPEAGGAKCGAADISCVANVVTGSDCAPAKAQPCPKAQLSPKAPAFVPRGGAAAPPAGCIADAPSDPHCSVLDPPRSDCTLSSSVVSRDADGGWGYGEGEGDDQTQPAAAARDNGAGGYYYCGGGEELGFDGYVCAAVAQGGELAPEDMYDTYNYGMYDGYVLPYPDACADSLGGTVYYEAGYESYGQQQGVYYWDEGTGAYVYGDVQYDAQYEDWQQYSNGADAGLQGAFQQHPSDSSAAFAWGDAARCLEAGLEEEDAAAGAGGDGPALDEEQLRSLARSDATELLEMFFPHYAGEALSRLLDRTGGDLMAAFTELSAMERQMQLAGAERAAAGGKAAAAGGRGGGRGGGRSAAGSGKGPAGGKRASGGGGAAAFKLDWESFPSLPPAAGPQPPKASPSSSPAPRPTSEATEQADGGLAAGTTTTTDAADNAATSTTTTTGPASSSTPAAAASPAKPNFAALLRNAAAAAPPAASPSADPHSHQRPSLSQREADAASGTSGPTSSSSRAAGVGAEGGAGGAAARVGRGVSAVPWVSTGEAVAAQYAEERREASLLARARNQYFQQATLAYLTGNKALAKELGRKGREMNEAMKEAHAVAARRIFAQRNAAHRHQHEEQQHPQTGSNSQSRGRTARPGAGVAAPGGARAQQGSEGQQRRRRQQQEQGPGAPLASGESMFVDLHGLHVAEAVTLLEAQIEGARTAGCRFLRVCTGTGHHTKGAKTPARLPSAVADTLLANHMTFKTLKPGLLEAQL